MSSSVEAPASRPIGGEPIVVVTTLTPDRLSELPSELKNLCATYPSLDGSNVAVVSDPTLKTSPAFLDFLLTYVTRPRSEWQMYKSNWVAAYRGAELTLFPADPDRTRTIKSDRSLCGR
jgi:hypothetical protein